MIVRKCLGSAVRPRCGRDVTPPASRCSECLNATRRVRRHPGYDHPAYRARRRKVKSRTCQRCHTRPAEIVHHRDGNPANNRTSNYEDLCSSCARTADEEMRRARRSV